MCNENHSGPADEIVIKGHFINLTKILQDAGFKRVPAVRGWVTNCGKAANGRRPRAEWWHWQLPEPMGTRWGDALKSVYTPEQINCAQTSKHKNYIVVSRVGSFRGDNDTKWKIC